MAEERKKRLMKIALTVFTVVAAALIFNKILEEWKSLRHILDSIFSAAAPIIVGLVIAFLMNPILVFFDRLGHTILQDRVIKDKRKLFKTSRAISIIFTMVIFLGIITGLFYMVIPQLYESIKLLIDNMETYYNNILDMTDNIFEKFKRLNVSEDVITNVINTVYERITEWVNTDLMPNLDKVVVNISSGVIGGLKFVYNFIIGIIASIYVMANKEYLLSRGKKVIYAAFKVKNANLLLDGFAEVNKVFAQFINGKIVDSIIIGLLTFIITSILDMPYALLISTIIGVTNVIPFFGPIIGAIPCVFIVLIADPVMSVVLLIVILVLQQFDGNILGPKILGDVTGLSSFWVLTAVIVGGGIFGFAGMLLSVPVFACCYMYINRTCTNKLKEKNLAYESVEYERIRRIDEETGEPIYITDEEADIRFKKKTPEEKAAIKAERQAKKKKLHIPQVHHDESNTEIAATDDDNNDEK
jgi:predicted PurR-regulated permease PerM